MYLVVRATEKPKLWSLSSVTLESSENEINKSGVPPHSIRLKVCRTKCIEQMQLRAASEGLLGATKEGKDLGN